MTIYICIYIFFFPLSDTALVTQNYVNCKYIQLHALTLIMRRITDRELITQLQMLSDQSLIFVGRLKLNIIERQQMTIRQVSLSNKSGIYQHKLYPLTLTYTISLYPISICILSNTYSTTILTYYTEKCLTLFLWYTLALRSSVRCCTTCN